jgi:hypothetical protein
MEGNLLRLSATREIAIYRREGVAWVADFRGGRGELFTPGEWFALNRCASLRAALASPGPLSGSVIERIERVHAAEDRAPLAAVATWLGDRLARFYPVPRMQRS